MSPAARWSLCLSGRPWFATSLRVRFGLLYAVLLAATLLLFSALLYLTLLNTLSDQVDTQLALQARQTERALHRVPGSTLRPEDIPPGRLGLPVLEDASASGLLIQVLDDRGRVLASSESDVHAPLAPAYALPPSQDEMAEIVAPDGQPLRVLIHPILVQGRPIGSVQVAASLQAMRATMASVLRLLALGAVLALSLAAAVGWWLAGRALRPLQQITSTALGIAQTGQTNTRLEVPCRDDEVGQLARAFNAMIARLDEAAQRQRAFLADTSHELRTPLTVLRGNLDLLRRDPDPLAREEYLRDADAEARRMARLVDDLLLLAQSDARQSVHRTPLALEEVVREVYEQALLLAEGPEVSLELRAHAPVLGDADRLKQLLWNLVDNALRHTPHQGRVTLTLSVEDRWTVIRVADTGVGIPSDDLPHIFERFYKVDRARSRRTGGTGLGLAIVQYLAAAHGGTVAAESTLGQGSTFTVRLPLAPEAEPSDLPGGQIASASPAGSRPRAADR